jgi:hypothetical protein
LALDVVPVADDRRLPHLRTSLMGATEGKP